MRKFYAICFSILIICCSSYSQETIQKITHSYFRSDPFDKEFSSFLTHLLNDPALTSKTIEKKTDSSFFFFRGTYTTFNPFFFKPKRVEVILSETPVTLDSLTADTIYTYQLMAYNNDTKEGTQELKKEFEKIYKRYNRSFFNSTYTENPWETKSGGGMYIFFDRFHGVAPFSLSWGGPDENKEMFLVLTIRMDTYNNQAILPVPFYTPQ